MSNLKYIPEFIPNQEGGIFLLRDDQMVAKMNHRIDAPRKSHL